MTWTTAQDVLDAWIGEGAPESIASIETWIGKAEREIRSRVPSLVGRIAAEVADPAGGTDLRETAKDVTVAMVIRVFRNPEGIRQTNTTTTTGPFSDTESRTYAAGVPGGLGLTDDELTKLQGDRGGAFSIDMIPSTSPFYVGPS